MKRLDMIIDALEEIQSSGVLKEQPWSKWVQALAAARELRGMKPVATRNGFSGVIEVEWGESVHIGTKLYALGGEK